MFFIENEGQAVARTDYWQSVQAQAGYVYLSWNAGAARLLVPDAAKHLLREMRGAEYVIISKGTLHGRDALELIFEDGSDAPFVTHMLSEQCDPLSVNATMFDRYLPFSCPLNTFVTDAVRFAPFHHH
ncbi:hypothetical protein [Escherichia coli]|uniref:hypothetical protein n=1 Tax=Escherichia coli TaxID=562 RepID=UPI000AAE8836